MINFSEILWKPHRSERGARPSVVNSEAEDSGVSAELALIPVVQVRIRPETRIVLLTDSRGPGADRFRFLRMRLGELKDAVNLSKVLITSPLPQDGKSTVALNLATALAENGRRRVLLIEADLYHPTIAQRLELPVGAGLGECLENGVDPFSVIRHLEPLGWFLLASGVVRGNPTELLQSGSFPKLLEKLSPHFDWILVDTPPVTPLTDAVSLSRHVDATLLVVRSGSTPEEAVKESIGLLGQKHVLGIVFNAAEELNQRYSKYYGHYAQK